MCGALGQAPVSQDPKCESQAPGKLLRMRWVCASGASQCSWSWLSDLDKTFALWKGVSRQSRIWRWSRPSACGKLGVSRHTLDFWMQLLSERKAPYTSILPFRHGWAARATARLTCLVFPGGGGNILLSGGGLMFGDRKCARGLTWLWVVVSTLHPGWGRSSPWLLSDW